MKMRALIAQVRVLISSVCTLLANLISNINKMATSPPLQASHLRMCVSVLVWVYVIMECPVAQCMHPTTDVNFNLSACENIHTK